MRLNHFRVPAAIASLALLVGTTAAPASAAPATLDCGIITCSLYLTRNTTQVVWSKLINYKNTSNAAIAGAAATACAAIAAPFTGPGAAVAGVACGGAGAVYGGFFLDKLENAATKRQCLRIRYPVGATPAFITGLYVDRSKFCKN